MPEPKTTQVNQKLEELKREGEERAAERRAKGVGLPYADLRSKPISIEAVKLVPEAEAVEAQIAAVETKGRVLAVGVFDPGADSTKRVIESLKKRKYEVKIFVVSLSSLKEVWNFYKYLEEKRGDITGEVGIDEKNLEELTKRWDSLGDFKAEMESLEYGKTKTTALLHMILAEALAVLASDIHFEAESEKIRVRFRMDGILHDAVSNLSVKSYESLVSRIKLLAGMKINIRGVPQDGRFTINLPKKEIEVRISILPSEFGETIVMRILDPEAISVTLAELGLRQDDLELVKKQLDKPNGLVLNTGPTGSGKTTTLYAFLKKLSTPEKKIITIEDPIEYRLPGIEQTQVDPGVEYTFAKGLRAIVRQDPDVVLVGEIRDLETAEIAMQAALTGHVVFSTLHTNDAVGAVPRLVDIGVRPTTIGPALSLVIAQRLVRRLCQACKEAVELSVDDKKQIEVFLAKLPERVDRKKYETYKVYKPKGCKECNGIGYKGRVGIFEFLEAGSDFEEVVLKEASEISLRKLADSQGMVNLQEDGVLKVLEGMTSFDEVKSVTGPIGWQ